MLRTRSAYALVAFAVLVLAMQALPVVAGSPTYSYTLTAPKTVSGPGVLVTATATTTNPLVTQVAFIWVGPTGHTVYELLVKSHTGCGTGCEQFVNQYTPTLAGNWKLYAYFESKSGIITSVMRIIYVSFIVLPEYPFGTLAAVGIPGITLFGYGLYRRNRALASR